MVSSKQVLSLYKLLLEMAAKFNNYNFREYSKRKIRDSFREHKGLVNEDEVNNFYNSGLDLLSSLQRQTAISQMYTFDKLVVEPLKKYH